jgi:glycosyltransferase involved in cell wall biosynthesis
VRIAVVHSFYSSAQPSGENTVVLQQVDALRSAGHDVHLIARHTDEESKRSGYAARSALTVASGRGASPADELSRLQPDVVHLHNTFPNFGTQWLSHWGERTVVTLHNYRTVCAAGTLFRDGHPCTDCLKTPVRPAIDNACYRGSRVASAPVAWATRPHGALRRVGDLCRRVLVLNTDAQAVFESQLGREVSVVPNFAAEAVMSGQAEPSGWAFVGRLSAEKGPAELIAAWPGAESLDLFGDGVLRDDIERLVSERGLARVRLRGLTPHAQVLEELSAYEGLIVPSMCAEGLPTAVLEALARSVPVIASSYVSFASDLESSGAGTAVQIPMNEASIQTALTRIRTDPSVRDAARSLHGARFSPDAWLKAIEPIYEQIAQSSVH